ncbi:MAG: asparagine synthase (glutamine-hydrolyzing) [Pyrinomonadaceae bacterium]
MCGIAGILHFGRLNDALDRVQRMANSIRHRGPDDDGFWLDADIALGFRRLSIVDLETGAQPMANEDGQVWVVFNGEIYNHGELRRQLEALGHCFRTDHSDTEVLVHGWEEWGEALPKKLNGMFAFAVWDCRRRTLFLARDRYGIKPLYIATLGDGTLVFGSEVRALHASGLINVAVEPSAVIEYFSLMNLWHGRTPFADVSMFPAGTCELVTAEGGRRQRYWDFHFDRRADGDLTAQAEALQTLLLDAIERQMAADVPVMTYLSGGIDSSAVTAAARERDRSVRAYSCIFDLDGVGDDRTVDEREFSRSVAHYLDIERIELVVQQDALLRALDPTIHALEYPRMGMAYVNYLIAQRVAQDAKVVLSGMGGDEVTGGYVSRYALVPRQGDVARSLWLRLLSLSRRVQRTPGIGPLSAYRSILNVPIPAHELKKAFTPEFLAAASGYDPSDQIKDTIARAPADDPWDAVMYVDATTYLHGLLVLEDKLSMAHSLETRVPLLDNDLVDYLLRIPWQSLCDGRTGKIAFREAVRAWVPDEVYAKPKMGFGPPDASWYRTRLRPWIEAQLNWNQMASRGVFQPDYVRRKLQDHFTGRANYVALIWCLLSFESWCRQYDVLGGAGDTDAGKIATKQSAAVYAN